MKTFVLFAASASAESETNALLQPRKPVTQMVETSRKARHGHGCMDADENVLAGVVEDCTHKDFYVFKGTPAENRGSFQEPTFLAGEMGNDTYWNQKPVEQDGWDTSCVAYVETDGGTCKEWCEGNGFTCVKGQDDAHFQTIGLDKWLTDAGEEKTDCTLHPASSARQSQDENGCNQRWKTQICGCSAPRVIEEKPPGCVDGNGAAFEALKEDCTHKDFFEFFGTESEMEMPSYDVSAYNADAWWATYAVQMDDWKSACVAYVETRGTCGDWCEKNGMVCVKGMDDAHPQEPVLGDWLENGGYNRTGCSLSAFSSNQKNRDANGCNADWYTQICACKYPAPP